MAKITIDFGCDFVREYTTTDNIDQKLRQGEMLKLETMHPRHAEHMKASTGEGGDEIKIPLELANNIRQTLNRFLDLHHDPYAEDEGKELTELIKAQRLINNLLNETKGDTNG